ncbi:MAG TPA: hypothetical protein VGW38_00190, partial [Chloroflexota bacterium]|nr:hypothetical protein [Chloroflexota bacterium]
MTTALQELMPSPLPTPPNFPVTWEDPAEATYFWTFDRAHAPEPMVPVDGVYFHHGYQYGITAAARAFEMPFRCLARRINTYGYLALVPLPLSPEEAEAQGKRSQEKLTAAMGRLAETWQGEFLPEIEGYLADWAAFDLRGAPMPALLAHLDESMARTKRLYEIHMLVAFPFLTAISLFDELYRDLFGSERVFDGFKLLQGFENKTVEGGRALWQLSRRALAQPEVRKALETKAAADVPAALEQTAAGRAFLVELRAYLRVWGQRGDRWGWSYPSWIEDPTPAIKNLKDYAAQPERDLEAEMATQVAERERLIAETRERLRGYPEPARNQFEFRLKAAQEAIVLTEDHAFWIDFRCMYEVRRVLLEVGRRLAEAGVLDEPAQVFY